jgi:hypothetical protein
MKKFLEKKRNGEESQSAWGKSSESMRSAKRRSPPAAKSFKTGLRTMSEWMTLLWLTSIFLDLLLGKGYKCFGPAKNS